MGESLSITVNDCRARYVHNLMYVLYVLGFLMIGGGGGGGRITEYSMWGRYMYVVP